MVKRIVWDKEAILQLQEAYEYLKEHSLRFANRIRKTLKIKIQELSKHPEIYNLDRYKINNDGTIRAFEVYSYRVTYKVKESEIIIARIRHSSREPIEY
jgi:plasmid stabilization system protein ParE